MNYEAKLQLIVDSNDESKCDEGVVHGSTFSLRLREVFPLSRYGKYELCTLIDVDPMFCVCEYRNWKARA